MDGKSTDKAEGWGVWELGRYNQRWEVHLSALQKRERLRVALFCSDILWSLQVPWGGRQLLVGLLAWASTFVAVGLIVMPLIARGVGVQARPLSCACLERAKCRMTDNMFPAELVGALCIGEVNVRSREPGAAPEAGFASLTHPAL